MNLSFEEGLKKLHEMLAQQQEAERQHGAQGMPSTASGSPDMLPGLGGDLPPARKNKASVFASLSASDDDTESEESIISSQLTSVRLPKERKAEYEDAFYPKRPAAFLPLIDELAALSSRTNGLFALLRYCLLNARRFANLDKSERNAAVNREAERIFANVTNRDMSDITSKFLDGLSDGNNHIIVPSKRHKGGFDLQFVGSPASPSDAIDGLPTLNVAYGEYGSAVRAFTLGGKDNDPTYQREYLEAYATELSQGCVRAGEQILKALFGAEANDYASAPKRLVRTVPMAFDFKSINDIIFDNTGIVLTVDFMENVSSGIVDAFGAFMDVAVVRTPRMELVRLMHDRLRRQESENPDNPSPVAPSFLEGLVTREGLALSQTLSFSFSISLPADIAHYITQAEDNETPSKLSLHNWASIWTRRYMRRKGARMSGGAVKRRDMPKFVPPLSKTQKITELRAQNNFHVEPGKGDEHNVYIAPNGTLQYGLPSSARDVLADNLSAYESDMEEYLTFCFEHGIPPQVTSTLPREVVAAFNDQTLAKKFKDLHSRVSNYSGKLLSYDWDYNNTITVHHSDSTSIVANDLVGAARLDTLTQADYLGFNFADEGEDPIRKSFSDSLVLMTGHTTGKDSSNSDYVSSGAEPVQFLKHGGVAPELLPFYNYCALKERVPGIEALIAEAAKELGITELSSQDAAIIGAAVRPDLTPGSGYTERKDGVERFLEVCITSTINHCNGGPILRQMVADENEGVSAGELAEEMLNHPHYFNPVRSPAVDFGRLYNYLGGMIFKIAMEHLTKVHPKDLFSIEGAVEINPYLSQVKPNYRAISQRVMPLAVMFSKYIPNGEQIFRDAEEEIEANKPDPGMDESDIRVSGGTEGGQMFPHQIRAHQSLRKRPKFSILDIAPGGGKTTLGVTDIGSMVTELNEIGERNIKPIILCPDGLIKNWVDDMKIFTGNKWNMIPVNGAILKRWGYERLEDLINDAPPNSIVVCGFNFLSAKRETVVVGTHSVSVSNNLEFMKRFGFDYICIDESHKLKTKSSQRHKTIKQLTTGSHVRYLRLATGTLISNKVDDIVGQSSLYNGHIFREGEVSNAPVSDAIERKISMNGDDVPLWSVDSPQRARQKLSRYASVITMKKKEWAFMLPSPIETFISVPMVPSENPDATESDIQLGEMHKQLYDAVLQESLEDLEELLKKAKSRKAASDDGDDEEDEGEGGLEMEEGDELSTLSSAELTPYLARIERLVTNPMADPLAPDIFGAAGVKEYHSTKAKQVAKRIDQHFNPVQWEKDKVYTEYTFLSHNGKLYLSRKLDKSTSKRVKLPESTRGVPPSEDTETWKEEAEGKVIIFCRYTNSVRGIYNALPDHYKRVAVKFTGEEDDKWANLDSFLNDPKTKILVANEMGIAEGHNMQLASRIIRIESPWAPGDLDQSSARIFRPDPKAHKDMIKSGKPGELAREAIFLDWILCDNTMEVAKQARLISKIFNKARFDEAENDTYDDVLSEFELDEIRMSLDTLRSRASLEDYKEYVTAYATLNDIQRREFHEMRVNMDHTMKNLEPQPEIPGSAKVQTPFVSNQKPEDPDGLNLISLRNMLRSEQHADLLEDPSRLKGQPVVTDLGKGRITKVNIRYQKRAELDDEGNPVRLSSGKIKKVNVYDSQGRKVVDPDNPISSITVKIAGQSSTMKPPSFNDTGIIFVPTTLDAKTAKRDFHVGSLSTTKSEERKEQREEERRRKEEEEENRRREKEEEAELIKEERRRRREKEQAKDRRKAGTDGKRRKRNIEEGKPVNTGIIRTRDVPPIRSGRMDEEAPSITLHPALYHGYLTLEMKADSIEPRRAKKLGFKETGPYAYVTTDRYRRFDKILDYIEEHFRVSDASARRLEEVMDAFDEGPKEIYRMELAPSSTLPYFFATRKRKVQYPKEIRPYPIILPDELQLAVDIATSPVIRKHLGKSIPGAVAKWKEHPGHLLHFANSKAELRKKMKELKAAGFHIANEDEAKAEITSIRFRASSNKK